MYPTKLRLSSKPDILYMAIKDIDIWEAGCGTPMALVGKTSAKFKIFSSSQKKSITFDKNEESFTMAYTITHFIAITIKV